MTFLVERLADLRQHLDHLRAIAPRVPDASAIEGDLSLHNDVLFSLLVVCQSVVDIAGELAGRAGIRFQDYTEAVRSLGLRDQFPPALVERLSELPGFRNILIREYADLDYDRVVRALRELEPIEEFVKIVARLEAER